MKRAASVRRRSWGFGVWLGMGVLLGTAGAGQLGCDDSDADQSTAQAQDGGDTTGGGADAGAPGADAAPTDPGDPQTPPIGATNVHAWLAGGAYRGWSCQSQAHPPSPPSTHGRSLVCSNAIASAHGGGEYPVGAASVIEFRDNADAVSGYGVSRHVSAGTDPATWYWYGEITGVFLGDGYGLGACSSCHARAGSSGIPGHDYVFVQVP